MNGNIAAAYRQVEVTTAGPGRLLIMCYEGAIEYLKRAIEYYEAGNLEKKAEAIARALDIIGELNRSLDFERGGEISVRLNALYNYMSKHITEGDLKRNTQHFQEVIRFLSELKEAWEEIVSGSQKKITNSVRVEQPSVPNFSHKIAVSG